MVVVDGVGSDPAQHLNKVRSVIFGSHRGSRSEAVQNSGAETTQHMTQPMLSTDPAPLALQLTPGSGCSHSTYSPTSYQGVSCQHILGEDMSHAHIRHSSPTKVTGQTQIV